MPVSLDRAVGGPAPTTSSTKPHSSITPKRWREILAPYSQPDTAKSVMQLLCTVVPFVALVAGIVAGLAYQVWWALVLVIPAGVCLLYTSDAADE